MTIQNLTGAGTTASLKFMLLFLMLMAGSTYAQGQQGDQQQISIAGTNITLAGAFEQIKKTTGLTVFYGNQLLDDKEKVTLNFKGAKLSEVLDFLLKNKNIRYQIRRNSVIVLEKKSPAGAAPIIEMQQMLSGMVTDIRGKPVPAVSVKIQGSRAGTTSNELGKYSLKGGTKEDVLLFSAIGFASQQIVIGSSKTVDVVLRETATDLDQVVVIGYGTSRKGDLTGSVGRVDVADLNKAPVASFSEALSGRVAGVQVSATDGQPGAAQEIVIRGVGSLTQSTAPLYVIDGFPVEDFDARSLNNDDIASLNILKDASATAIYGARAANGVVIIETKKGKAGKPVVTINSSYGFQQVGKELPVMDPYDYVKYQLEINTIHATERYLKDGRTLESYRNTKGINWHDQVFQRSPYYIQNLAIRGGNELTKYSVSGSIYDQHGIILNTGSKRYQGRLSLDQTLSKKIKTGITVNYSNSSSYGVPVLALNGGNSSSFFFSNVWGYRPLSGDPNLNLIDQDVDPDIIDANYTRVNPIVTAENFDRTNTSLDLLVNTYLTYAISNNLTLKVTGTANSRKRQFDAFYNSKTPQGSPLNPLNVRGVNGEIRYTDLYNWSNENTLSYQKTFNNTHKINILGGFSLQGSRIRIQGVSVQNLPNEKLRFSGFDEGTPYYSMASDSEFTLSSFYSRFSYNLKSKYMLDFTIRADGSSKFAPGHRWGYFPSAALAWNMKEELFLKDFKAVSSSKIRASIGNTGNNRVNDFAYLGTLQMPIVDSYSFNNAVPTKGLVPTSLGNRNLKWEVTQQIDIGYDLGLFQDRLEFTADVYRKTTSDLLLYADLPYTTGFSQEYKNIGKIRNDGLELSLNSVNIKNDVFSWKSSFNISFNRNKILALTRGQENLFSFVQLESQYNNSPLYLAKVGQPAAMFYGYIFDGVYQYADFDSPERGKYKLKLNVPTNGNSRETIQPGDIKYKDLNNDGVTDDYDQTIIGRGFPKHTGGFSNNLTYKNFDLNVLFQWSYGNDVYNANRLLFEGNGLIRLETNQYASYLNRWSPENQTNANYRSGGQGPLGRFSSRVIEDGSYLRLKTLSLGYNLPEKILKPLYLSGLRINVSAQNLLTWTNYSGMDPEVSARNSNLTPGFDFSAYPQAKTFVLGINATF